MEEYAHMAVSFINGQGTEGITQNEIFLYGIV